MNSVSFPKIFNILTVFFMPDQTCQKNLENMLHLYN